MIKHTEQYSEIIKKYMVRQLVKPGITGAAQIRGFQRRNKRNRGNGRKSKVGCLVY